MTIKARRKDNRLLCSGANNTCRGEFSVLFTGYGKDMLSFDDTGWHLQPRDIDGLPVYALSRDAQRRYDLALPTKDRRTDPRNHPGRDRPYETSMRLNPAVPSILICPRCGKPNLLDPVELNVKPNSAGLRERT